MREKMPPDPFNSNAPDMGPFAANCRGMYTSLLASGFKEAEALEITIRVTCAMFMKTM
jgi:hypothetical protein